MKLETISVANFGSYVQADLDLRGVSAATVVGPNGAGKSTLCVDSVLWALFGKCRTETDKMIRIGAETMSVAVIFRLHGQRYQVRRTRSLKTKAGKSELVVMVEADGRWQPVSGARLVDTQAKIEQLLSADYALLASTGFLLQGQADRFSRATPAERKAILAQILRLDQYALLRQAANREGITLTARRPDLAADLEQAGAQAAELPTLEASYEQQSAAERQVRQALAALDGEQAALRAERDAGQAKLDALPAVADELEAVRTALRDTEQEIARLTSRQAELITSHQRDALAEETTREALALADRTRASLVEALTTCRSSLGQVADVEADLTAHRDRLQALDTRSRALNERRDRLQRILSRAADIRAKVGEQGDIERAIQAGLAHTTQWQTTLQSLDAALQEVRQRREHAQRLQMEALAKRQEIATAVRAYADETKQLEAALERDTKAVALLGQVPCDAGLQARCQFTVQAVDAQRRIPEQTAALAARPRTEEAIAALVVPDLVSVLAGLDQEREAVLRECESEDRLQQQRAGVLSNLQGVTREQETLQGRLTKLREWTVLVPELEQAERELPTLEADLANLQAEMADVQERRQALERRREEQHELREQEGRLLADLTACDAQKQELETSLRDLLVRLGQAQAEGPTLAAALQTARDQAAASRRQIATLEQTLAERQALSERQATVEAALAACDQQRASLDTQLRDVLMQMGQVAERMQAAREAQATAGRLRAELAALDLDLRHYQALTDAYERIPILILESSIPLLEAETNRLLARISASGMRITLATQRALKSREGLAETLDITVRDVYGERPYESFSGGERARLDLALRVGLSKLLAHRAGARIETLVMDEAFAAVDREGVEALVECLPILSQEFSPLLFITHDESFKSAVAQQLVVSKNGTGSTVEIVA